MSLERALIPAAFPSLLSHRLQALAAARRLPKSALLQTGARSRQEAPSFENSFPAVECGVSGSCGSRRWFQLSEGQEKVLSAKSQVQDCFWLHHSAKVLQGAVCLILP